MMEAVSETVGIGDAARAVGLSVDTLRYYERAGLLDGVLRTEGNQRRYGEDALRAVQFVTKLRLSGMPIRTIRRYMSLNREGDSTLQARLRIMAEHRDSVRRQLTELQGYLEIIEMKIDLYERGVHPQSDDPCARRLARRLSASGENK